MSALASPAPLRRRALTLALDDAATPVDPWAAAAATGWHFERAGLALAGLGRALVLDLPGGLADAEARARAAEWLAAVAGENRVGGPGTGVLALGSLPFDPTGPGQLVIPEVLFGRRDDGARWVTVVDEAVPEDDAAVVARAVARLRAPEPVVLRPEAGVLRPQLTNCPAPAAYAAAVARAVTAMTDGPLRKVVLARTVELAFPSAPSPSAVVDRLRRREPGCAIFSVPADPGRFLGASPELLISRRGPEIRAHPLAGTVGLAGDPLRDDAAVARFLASDKERREHRYVVDEILAALAPFCGRLEAPSRPALVRLRSVAHFGTPIRGRLRDPWASALDLLGALHPTPAVGGVPRAEALAEIPLLEAAPRHQWSGPVGWVDAAGDGDFVTYLRRRPAISGPVRSAGSTPPATGTS
jgi:menaquinone-specific isochorismate synthase